MANLKHESDEDMKIVLTDAEKNAGVSDVENTFTELRRQKRYGNIGRAKKAGSTAATVAAGEVKALQSSQDTADKAGIFEQMCCVVAFGVMNGFERGIRNEILVRVTLNAFYDTLKKEFPAFHESINSLASMSFYYLCARRGDDIANEIGMTFASLCKKAGDDEYEKMGRCLYEKGILIAADRVRENLKNIKN